MQKMQIQVAEMSFLHRVTGVNLGEHIGEIT